MVLDTEKVFNQGESQIRMTDFSVDFMKEKAKIDIKGIGGKVGKILFKV